MKFSFFSVFFCFRRCMCVHRWPIYTRALAKMIGVSNTPVFRCFCMTKDRHVHVPFPGSHIFWPNVVRVLHSGKIVLTTCLTIVWLDQHSIQCACQLVRFAYSRILIDRFNSFTSILTCFSLLLFYFQIIQKWLVSVSIQIRRHVTFGRASNDWLVIPRTFRWVCPGASENKANVQNRHHCHKNHKFRSRANSLMWPASPQMIHSDILACKHLSGIRSIIENHEPFVSWKMAIFR